MATTTSPSSSKNDSSATGFTDRINYPLNIQPFVPIPLTHQQQIYLQQQQQRQQQQSKLRMSQLGGKDQLSAMVMQQQQQHQQPEYCPNEEDDSPPQMLDPNIYSTKKTVMTILCLIIIIMANSIQLKFVIKNAGTIHNQFYSAQVGLGVTSVLLAAFIGVFLMYVAMLDFNDPYEHRKLEMLNNIAIVSLFVLIVLNIFLVAFQG